MVKTLCDEAGCDAPAIGYVPFDVGARPSFLCADHYAEALSKGYFACLLSERVCWECGGLAWLRKSFHCARCSDFGKVLIDDKAKRRVCTHCKGTGLAPRMGRPPKGGWE